MYQPRVYRSLHRPEDLVSFEVTVKETDLFIACGLDLKGEAEKEVILHRAELERYIAKDPRFLRAVRPVAKNKDMPLVAELMAEAAELAGVGPMAAVAGVFADLIGQRLLLSSSQVIVENGGDIFVKTEKQRVIGIYSGERSPFKDKLAVEIHPEDTPLGICTSSGTVGHSQSFGKADSATVIAGTAALADAAATALGNIIQTADDFPAAIRFAKGIAGLRGVILVKEDKFSVWGDVTLC